MSRRCVKCGKLHGMVIEDREGNVIEELDKCYDCIFAGTHFKLRKEQIKLFEDFRKKYEVNDNF